jgi:rSAM/selenodomain-associated transferase 1
MANVAEKPLLIFARLPRAGKVKRRLAAVMGAQGAAQLYARMVEKSLQTASAAGFARIYLYCEPDTDHAYFRGLRRRYGVRLRAQGGGDLGDRMYRALRTHAPAVLIGTDCPALKPADLRSAASSLDRVDVVLSPAEDGGYALIAASRLSRELFDGVAWGSARVLRQTRARIRRLGWHVKELRTVWDVDRPADLARLRRSRTLAPLARAPGALSDKRKIRL